LGGNRKSWCESCGQQGHKFYECPEKLLQNNADVWCDICYCGSHPTNDCPKKKDKKFTALAIQDNPDEQLYRLLQDVKSGSSKDKEAIQAITYGKETGKMDIQAEEEH
jgi:hypothetical protein